jgi:2-oxoglutarate dehydrogenase E2 component (dihydrolipoamide succinyltransferase)
MGTPTGGNRGSERTKLSMLRRKVAERLVSAKNETAMLTTFNEVNMTAINTLYVINTKKSSKQNTV